MTHSPTRPILTLLATSALAASLAACASPNFPIEPTVIDPPPAARPQAPVEAPPVREAEPAPEVPRPTQSVESRPLDSAPPAAPRAAEPPIRPAYVPPPAPTYRTVTTRSVTGKVVEVEGPAKSYTVKKGDNLEEIAKKLDTTVEQLAKDNKLKKPYVIHPGDDLKGPKTTAKAYTVGSGDTLFSIARRFSVTADALREENDLKKNASLRPGQKLRLPKGYKDKGPTVTTSRVQVEAPAPQPTRPAAPPPRSTLPAIGSQPPRTATPAPEAPVRTSPPPVREETPPPLPSRPQPYRPSGSTPRPSSPPPASSVAPSASRPVIPGAPVASPPVSDSQVSSLGRGRFVWPVRGDLLSSFGPKGTSQRNDGVNIGAPAGEAVRAAAAGDVVYAGDQVPGFGNLVLIKHADGWVTAYGHLGRVDVKMQQKVAQGQQIGQVGTTGGVAAPQLHFEVRYAPTPEERARPIDPALVLPR
ncbi:peptidoglycan DD-metalloendopeptidase family protein [Phenylobacterium sp. VNQ135]|uniref:peptidoglycan DD-metalloendopeptidase family protein n=1 Tax=Phenylobacterium sp. VNQ135 TaxID=3400922 RepID=UPI003C007931